MPPRVRAKTSSGLLLYRRQPHGVELFLAHPGGPFWKNRDDGAWTIPKGAVNEGEAFLDAACREFEEETGIHPTGPFVALGHIRQKGGKVVHAWAWEGDADPATITSNLSSTEWPRGSGRMMSFPEVDRCSWFAPDMARAKILAAQTELIDRLLTILDSSGTAAH